MFLFAEIHQGDWLSILLAPESNVLNWVLLIAVLWWLCAKTLPPVLKERSETIETEITSAAQAKENALKQLEEQKQKVALADKEAEQILVEAKQAAEQMRIQIEKQTEREAAELLKKFEAALANERQMAVFEMRSIATKAAIKLAEENLRSSMTEATRAKLLTQFVEQLDQVSANKAVIISNGN